jgi:hypothetical protein
VLPQNYPERLVRVVIYPMPAIVQTLWRMMQSLLDPKTRRKFKMLSGPSDLGAPCPVELKEVISFDQLPFDAQKMHQELDDSEYSSASE